MDPYRSAPRDERAEAPRDQGIVGDVIRQFADPLAFYRELVQNAIDAGTRAIDIKLEYVEAAGVLRVAVKDRGEGMTRDILENQLLVLFRSTKERDEGKIGKFGIGFTSVLAPDPDVVAVHTSRDGRRLTLHLHRDLTYQLFDAGPATQTGTTVELDLPKRADEVAAFVQASLAALERWCRHASVPIELVAHVPGTPDPVTARIDRPLALDGALVQVERRTPDARMLAVVGLTAPPRAYSGFFNHGLMLHETAEPLLGPVALKLQDARLGHTLSRDDVRRDAHFERALDFARSIVERELPAAASTVLRGAAEAGDHDRWWTIAEAIVEARLELPRGGWWFPLLEPHEGRRAIGARELPRRAWASERSTELTRLAAARGPVLRWTPAQRVALRQWLDRIAGCTVDDVEAGLTCIAPVAPTDADTALFALVREHLAALHRAPTAIVLARLTGTHADALAVAGDPDASDDAPYLADTEQLAKNPFGRRRQALVLNVRHGWLVAARQADPRTGASLLVRVLLRAHGLLDDARSTALLERVLDQLGVEA